MSQDFDAQHALEQKALRKVRALVDNLEAHEQDHSATTVKVFVFVTSVVFLAIGVLIAAVVLFRPPAESAASQQAASRAAQTRTAAFEKSRAQYALRPRMSYVDEAMEPRFTSYVGACNAKIDKLRDTTYRSELAGVDGKARVTFGVRFDGIIETVKVKEWSGHPATEASARRTVMNTGTCGDFPEEIRKDTEILYITRDIEFKGSSL